MQSDIVAVVVGKIIMASRLQTFTFNSFFIVITFFLKMGWATLYV